MTDPTHDMPTRDDEMLNDDEIILHGAPPPLTDTRYLLLVGGLLLIISVTLGYLWQGERRRRIAAEKQVVEMKVELDFLRARAAYGGKLTFPMLPRPASRPSGGTSGGP